jgi:hypothetical protein
MSQSGNITSNGVGNADELESAINRRRIEQIFNAQETVSDVEGRIEERRTLEHNPLSQDEERRLVLLATQQFIAEVEPLLRPETPPSLEAQSGRDYWTGEEVGRVQFPDGSSAEVESLRQYHETEWPINYTYSETTSEPPYGRREETQVARVYPPLSMSRTAKRLTRLFLADVGLDIAPGEADTENQPF